MTSLDLSQTEYQHVESSQSQLTTMQGQRPSMANVTIQNSTVPKGYTVVKMSAKFGEYKTQLNLAQI